MKEEDLLCCVCVRVGYIQEWEGGMCVYRREREVSSQLFLLSVWHQQSAFPPRLRLLQVRKATRHSDKMWQRLYDNRPTLHRNAVQKKKEKKQWMKVKKKAAGGALAETCRGWRSYSEVANSAVAFFFFCKLTPAAISPRKLSRAGLLPDIECVCARMCFIRSADACQVDALAL